ncbi:RHS repeat-associated core domain-containing protein [uncultured Bacteroides sp.]|uniref:RHS repeat-associated core domain-containing protein n=1 Tax=uncultured Bacteroides sp. TaxID=162156 RepID=UPI00259ABA4D|nr:RHS repeat-associated core domain-containing protein [uncultured Bacteroides sp.]
MHVIVVTFIFRGEEIITEETTEGMIRYIRTHELLASDAESARIYYHYASDEMGSITHVTAGAEILNRYEYDAWGVPEVCKEQTENRFLFNGQQYDAVTGQYYLRARFYNPVIGRFTQEDTYRGDGLNLYTYCQNNPVYYVDPSGHQCESGATRVENQRESNTAVAGEPRKKTKAEAAKIKTEAVESGKYSEDIIQYEKLKSQYTADEIYNAERIGSSLKDDPSHRAASYLSKEQLANGRTYSFTGGDNKSYTLLQTKGQLDGVDGIFEYITNDAGQVTHQRFIKGGIYTGFPNQVVPKGGY